MISTVTVTYKTGGSPATPLFFELTGKNVDDIYRKLALKKKELDENFNNDPQITVLIWVSQQ